MDYKKIYSNIVRYRKNNKLKRKGNEQHHIIPRSLGGSNKLHNLVTLTPKEHYICHLLLTRIVPKDSPSYHSMIHAWNMMSAIPVGHVRYKMSKGSLYEKLKREYIKSRKTLTLGNKNSQYGTIWIVNKKTEQTKKINKNSKIPKGWIKGKIVKKIDIISDIFKLNRSKFIKNNKKIVSILKYYNYPNPYIKKNGLIISDSLIKKYREYYFLYKKHGFNKFVEITGYKQGIKNLIKCFSRNVPEYAPRIYDYNNHKKEKKNKDKVFLAKRKCIIDNISYSSIAEAQIATGINRKMISKYLVNNVFDRKKYELNCLKKSKNKRSNNSKPIRCIVDNIEYKTITEASLHTHISNSIISKYLVDGVFNRKKYEESCLRCNKTPQPPLKKPLY